MEAEKSVTITTEEDKNDEKISLPESKNKLQVKMNVNIH
jgi:hypothetical protein